MDRGKFVRFSLEDEDINLRVVYRKGMVFMLDVKFLFYKRIYEILLFVYKVSWMVIYYI